MDMMSTRVLHWLLAALVPQFWVGTTEAIDAAFGGGGVADDDWAAAQGSSLTAVLEWGRTDVGCSDSGVPGNWKPGMPKDFCRSNPRQEYQTDVSLLMRFGLGCAEGGSLGHGIFGSHVRGDGSRVARFSVADAWTEAPMPPPTPGPSPPGPLPPGPPSPAPSSDCSFLENIQLYDPGGNHTKPPIAAKDSDACCGVCMADPDCFGAELYGGSCYVKTAKLPQVKQTPPKGVPLVACVRKNHTTLLETTHAVVAHPPTVTPADGATMCGRFTAPAPLPWRACSHPVSAVASGVSCGCEQPLTQGTSYRFRLSAAGVSGSGYLWNCTIEELGSGGAVTLLGQVVTVPRVRAGAVGDGNPVCTPVIVANRTRAALTSGAGGYFAAASWSGVQLTPIDGGAITTPTTAGPVQGAAPGGPPALCHRIGAFRNESITITNGTGLSLNFVGGWNASGPACEAAARQCGGAWCYPPPPPPIWGWPTQPAVETPSGTCKALPRPWPRYTVTQRRANGGKPLIDSKNPPGSTGSSTFHFNLVPAYVKLPDGTDALLTRSVNSSGQCYGNTMQCDGNGTCDGGHQCTAQGASTAINPDYITLTRYKGGTLVDPDKAELEPITDASISLRPSRAYYPYNKSGNHVEDCGVQDPRVVYDGQTETYWMAYTTFGFAEQSDKGPIRKDTCGGGGAGCGIASSKDPSNSSRWTRHGYGQLGKSAALLVRESGPHYAFFGIPSISVAVSWDMSKSLASALEPAFSTPTIARANPVFESS